MPLPSLNLGRFASRIDEKILSAVAQSAGRKLSFAARSSVGPMARFGAKAAITGGAAAIGLGAAAVTAVAGLGFGAARLHQASLNAPTFRADSLFEAPFVQRGGSMLTWEKQGRIPFTQRHFFSPMASPRFANMIGSVGVVGGVVGGMTDFQNSRNWNVTRALNTGALEVERDNFMGATGSLTLAMYRQRYGRPAPQEMNQAGLMGAAMHMDRTEMVHALHMAHMATLG